MRVLVSAAAGTLAVDQLTKLLALNLLVQGAAFPVVGTLIRFTLVRNPGIVWGLLARHPRVLTGLSAVVVIGLVAYLAACGLPRGLRALAFGLVIGGASGNLVDRVFRAGGVVDFIDIGTRGVRWPAFNCADLAITAGVLTLAWLSLRGGRRAKRVCEQGQ